MSDSTKLLTKEELKDRCLHLFKGGLRMVECFTTTAIIILESNIAGITGIYYGLEQWGNFLGHYLTMFEKSIENFTNYKLECANWSNGFYLIRLTDAMQNVYSSKIVLSK